MSKKKPDAKAQARMFVDQVNDHKKFAEKRSMDVQERYNFFLQENNGNVYAAIDTLMYTDPLFRARFNALEENRDNVSLQLHYDLTAINAEDEEYLEKSKHFRAAPLDTASNPGGANIIQTALSDTILYKSEALGQILSAVTTDTIDFGNKEYPRIVADAVGEFIDEDTTAWTDITPTTYEVATNGLTKVTLTPRDFGLKASYTQRLLKKVSPAAIAFFRSYESKGLTRGLEQQILRGNAAGQNATGMTQVATVVVAAGNAYETLNNAVGVLGATNTDNIIAVMHRKTWQEFKKLRVINESYREVIDPVNLRIDDIPVIISNNADASVATSGNVIVGDMSHYLMVKSGGIETLEDPYTNASTRTVNVYHTTQVDLAAWQANSFATFTVTF